MAIRWLSGGYKGGQGWRYSGDLGYLPNRREKEILDWLLATGNENTPWIAIDDAVWQFEKHRDRLVARTWYRGIDAEVETQLMAILEKTCHDPLS